MSEKIKPKALALTFATAAFILDVAGYVWHGLLGQPSFMNDLYPGFWGDPVLLLWGLAGTLAGAYVLGYIFAWVYNWAEKR
ncbi:MAG: hypothetical protein HYW25_01695 [Candidatus Aenigmarchaeota archaeon]|nr:hypothetical protein [Candidatus Aenigmarchaeota archaeon]